MFPFLSPKGHPLFLLSFPVRFDILLVSPWNSRAKVPVAANTPEPSIPNAINVDPEYMYAPYCRNPVLKWYKVVTIVTGPRYAFWVSEGD